MAEIEGTAQVDGLLDTVSPLLFKRWRAYFRVRDAEAWEIAGTIASHAWNAAILASGMSPDWKRAMLHDWDWFVPSHKKIRRRKIRRRKVKRADPKEGVAALAAVLNALFGPKG